MQWTANPFRLVRFQLSSPTHTDTGDIMSKNPYEIRLETLKMAKEMADQQFQLQMDFMYRMMDQANEAGADIKEAYEKCVPDMYKPEEIVKRANELYAYVSEKK